MSQHFRKRRRAPFFKKIPHDRVKRATELSDGELMRYASRALMRAEFLIYSEFPSSEARRQCKKLRRLAGALDERGRNILHPKKPKLRFSEALAASGRLVGPIGLLKRPT